MLKQVESLCLGYFPKKVKNIVVYNRHPYMSNGAQCIVFPG